MNHKEKLRHLEACFNPNTLYGDIKEILMHDYPDVWREVIDKYYLELEDLGWIGSEDD